MKTINVLDFNEYPGLRHCSISDFSGEEYYHSVLNLEFKNAFDQSEQLVINLDGTDGYASSFLDEAFGNLVYDFKLENVNKLLKIISNEEPRWIDMIVNETYLQWEDRRRKGKDPIVTKTHDAWYRFNDNQLTLGIWAYPTL